MILCFYAKYFEVCDLAGQCAIGGGVMVRFIFRFNI